jgi:hypothetical protein
VTLSDLVALAEEKVPGFERPRATFCESCNRHISICVCSEDEVFDNSPAALAMAVFVYLRRHCDAVYMTGTTVEITTYRVGRAVAERDDDESIARALLTALLRAHGVEVPSEWPTTI